MDKKYIVHQFEDKSLSHFSYAIVSNGEMILIDPARYPQPYIDFANQQNATIVGVIETHPHADFISGHLEISKTIKCPVYISKLAGATYAHTSFDEGDSIDLGDVKLYALNTPGHSPDSICILLKSVNEVKVVFTGDTLFIGDCGRPDLRENTGNLIATKQSLASNMYHSLRNKLLGLNDDVIVFPAHGAGTLCGKNLSDANSSAIGNERLNNWSLQTMNEHDFVKELLADQPVMPKYFGFNVALNLTGALNFAKAVAAVKRITPVDFDINDLNKNIVIIDTRPQDKYKISHLSNSFNIMMGAKFETWLGSIISPNEQFYLTAETDLQINELINCIAKIGYETQIAAAFIFPANEQYLKSDKLQLEDFKRHKKDYTIIDIRSAGEVKENPIFIDSINIPLSELRERSHEVLSDKPIVVHCAGGYRSAAGSSIVKTFLPNKFVYDLGEAVKEF